MNLATRYLGLDLDHPIIASASPLGRQFDSIRSLEDAGAAAIVLPSVYEEEVEAEWAEFWADSSQDERTPRHRGALRRFLDWWRGK